MNGNTIASLLVRLGLDSKDFTQGISEAKSSMSDFGDNALKGMAGIGGTVLAGIGALAAGIGTLGVKTGMSAAEVKQMRMVTEVMGDTAGYTTEKILEQRNALIDAGITYGGTETVLQSLMAAQIDVGQATELSRMAQNLAVKTGEDSTETTLKLVSAIELGSSQLAKGAGLTISFADAQKKYAEELGKSVTELTDAEKTQANYNAVMEKGLPFMGLYEEAMEHPIKQLGSLNRLFDTLSVEIGKYFVPAISSVIAGFSGFVKGAIEAVSEGGALEPILQGLGDVFSWLGDVISKAFVFMGENIPVFLEKLQNAWVWLMKNKGVIVGVFAALGAAIGVFVYTVIIPAVASIISAIWPALLIMAAIGLAAYVLYEAWSNNWLGIRDALTSVWENTIKPALSQLWEWLQVAIPAAIAWLSALWSDTLQPAMEEVWEWVQAVVFPIIETLWNWIQNYLITVIDAYALLWTEVVWPAMKKLWLWVQTTVFPIIATLWDWIKVKVPEAIAVLTDFWENKLLPAITAVWSFIENDLFPLFMAISGFMDAAFSLAVTALSGLWENVLYPAFEKVWAFVKENVMPVFEAIGEFMDAAFSLATTVLAGLWQNVLYPALKDVTEWVEKHTQPIFEKLEEFWNDKFLPIIEKVSEWLGNKLQPAFEGIKGVLNNVVEFIQQMTDKLKALEGNLPDWLTPGSPTPFELGLAGIGKELDALNRRQLPMFASNLLDINTGEMPVSGMLDIEGGGGSTTNFYITSPMKPEEALTPTQTVRRLSMLYGVN